jgi:CheY-like chemotaxis protein
MFERFRQGDSASTRRHDGLGLGLSIARQLVEAHRGTIAAFSEGRGCGTTFTVRLPAVGAPEGRQPETAVPPVLQAGAETDALHAMPTALEGVRVLVVDDEPDSREIMSHALRGAGAMVHAAAGCAEALSTLERTRVDVLLSDIAMPDEDGYALIYKVRSSSNPRIATLPAAAVTAHVREDERRRALEAGFQEHVPKPIDVTRLPDIVFNLVRSQTTA